MDVDLSIDSLGLDLFRSYEDFAGAMSCWCGRDVTWKGLPELKLDAQGYLMGLISRENRESEFLMYKLAWLGASPEKRPLVEREIAHLIQIADEWKIIPAGGLKYKAKKISKGCKDAWDKTCKITEKTCGAVAQFWEDHKTEIIVGAAICATGVGIAYLTGYTLGASAAGVIVAGAGSIFSESNDQPNPHIPKNVGAFSSSDLAGFQQPLPNPELPSSPDELLITSKGIWINGQFFSNETLQSSLFVEKLTCFGRLPGYQMPLYDALPLGLNLQPYSLEEIIPIHPKPSLLEGLETVERLHVGSDVLDFNDPPMSSSSSWLFQGLEAVGRFHIDTDILDFNAPLSSALERSRCFEVPGIKKPHCAIGWINGVGNTFEGSTNNGAYLQKLAGGYTISGIYNCTHTVPVDLLEAGVFNHPGYSPITAELLRNEWEEFHKANADRPNAKFLQVCHSQGAIHVKNALKGAPQEIRDRIIVLAIAPAAVVPDHLCFKSYNYASKKDIVAKLSPRYSIEDASVVPMDSVLIPSLEKDERLDYWEELIILPPHQDSQNIDHEFQSPTFQRYLQNVFNNYDEHEGEYIPEEKGKWFLKEK